MEWLDRFFALPLRGKTDIEIGHLLVDHFLRETNIFISFFFYIFHIYVVLDGFCRWSVPVVQPSDAADAAEAFTEERQQL